MSHSRAPAPLSPVHTTHTARDEPRWRVGTWQATFRLLATERTLDGGGALADPDPAALAAGALVARCEELLASFPTTLEEDLGALADRGISEREVNAACFALARGDGDGVSVSAATSSNSGQVPKDPSGSEPKHVVDVVALQYRAGKKMVLHAAMRWLRERWADPAEPADEPFSE